MDIWKVLEIEPCKDKQKITEAYREKLLVTNPEDSEEDFKKLRAAYEEALAYAETKDEEAETDNTPLGIWMQKVDDTYRSVRKRGDISCWRELLSDDLCVGLDTKIEARDRLLTYLSEHFRLPQDIWKLLDETFEMKEQRKELCDIFPEGFINYIFREIEESSVLPFDLFQGDEYADYDSYINLLAKSTRDINARELDDAKKTLEELKETGIYHPYHTINEIRIHLINQEFEQASSLANDLYMIYPDDPEVILYMGETSLYLGKTDEAAAYYDRHLEIIPKSFLGRFGKADCLKNEKKYEEAKELLISMLDDYPYNEAINQQLKENNELMIRELEKTMEEHPEDMKSKLEYGWSCLQNQRIEEGIAVLDKITEPEGAQKFSLENLSGRLYMENKEYDKALIHLQKFEQMIRELPPEVPEELEKDKNRLHLPLYLQAFVLDKMGRADEAFQKLEESLALKKGCDALSMKAYFLYEKGKYEEVVEVCNQMEEIDNTVIGIYAYRGKALFEMGYYQAAFDDFDRWIGLYAYELEPYIYKMRIFLYYEQYDRAKEIADYLVSQKVKSDRLDDCVAQIMEATGTEAQKREAYEMYKTIVEKYEKGESDVKDIYRIIYYMAVADENDRPLSYVLDEIEKGLSYKKDYIALLDYKAYLLNKNQRQDEALAVYDDIIRYAPYHRRAHKRVGDIYYNRDEYTKALEHYQKQREIENSQEILIDIGRAYIELDRLDEAKEINLEALRMDPEEACLYHNLGLICRYQRNWDEAIAYYEAALEHYRKKERISANTSEQLAACYICKGQYEKALEVYEAVRKETDNPYYYVEISDMYKYLGRYKEAFDYLEKYGKTADNDRKKTIYERARLSLMILSGDEHKAYKIMKKGKINLGSIADDLADYYIVRKDYKKAAEVIRKRVEDNPGNINILRHASSRTMWIGDANRARAMARDGLRLLEKEKNSLEDYSSNYRNASIFYAVLGDYQRALSFIDKARECVLCARCKYNVCKDTEICLAIILEMMGDKKQALMAARKCASYCKDDTELYLLMKRLEG